jgi:hypothetical protein
VEFGLVKNKKLPIVFAGCFSLMISVCLLPSSSLSGTSVSNDPVATCGKRPTVVNALKKDYKEVQQAIGLSNGGGLIEIFASPRGSFSITITNPSQITCIISAGEHWNKGINVVSSSTEM